MTKKLCQSAAAGQPCGEQVEPGQVLCQKHIEAVKALRCYVCQGDKIHYIAGDGPICRKCACELAGKVYLPDIIEEMRTK
jgi:hypothetical protein